MSIENLVPGQHSGVLGSDRIRQLLDDGILFESGTWDAALVRRAGYDLVIATDDFRIPDPHDPDKTFTSDPGEHTGRTGFVLEPGDFAYVTSRERIVLPMDIAGNIGIKNRFAKQGLLILTGLLIDPGYGMEQDASGQWVPAPAPLHFGIANVGRDRLSISFEKDLVASVQFLDVSGGTASAQPIVPPKTDDPVASGFVLFREFEKSLSELQREMNETKANVGSVVTLGVYVILATFIGALAAIILGSIANDAISTKLTTAIHTLAQYPWETIGVVVAAVSLAVVAAAFVLWPISRLLVGRGK